MPNKNLNLFAFIERLKTMSAIRRFGTLPMIGRDSVAGHSFNVAIFSLLIADYEPESKVNMEKLLRQALFHDFEETILSDIPHPIKHRFLGGKLGKLLKEIVPELIEKEIFKELPAKLRKSSVKSAQMAKQGLEGKIVEAADGMDIVATAIREIKLGNRYFENVYDVGIKMVQEHMDLKFVKMFYESAQEYRKKGEDPYSQPTFPELFEGES